MLLERQSIEALSVSMGSVLMPDVNVLYSKSKSGNLDFWIRIYCGKISIVHSLVTITTFVGRYIVPEIITINNIHVIVILRPFYATVMIIV